MRTCFGLFLIVFSCHAGPTPANLVTNGGFESGLTQWRPIWSRQPEAASARLDQQIVHSGTNAAHIDHTGTEDWSFEPAIRLPVQTGDIFELEAWLSLDGPGSASLCVSTWDTQNRNVSWAFGERTIRASKNWALVRSRFAIPPGVTSIQPRLIGYGQATVWVDDYSLVKLPGIDAVKRGDLPGQISLTNSFLVVSFSTSNATFAVSDLRAGRAWKQQATHADVVVTSVQTQTNRLLCDLVHIPSGLNLRASLELDPTLPEISFAIEGKGELPAPCAILSLL